MARKRRQIKHKQIGCKGSVTRQFYRKYRKDKINARTNCYEDCSRCLFKKCPFSL